DDSAAARNHSSSPRSSRVAQSSFGHGCGALLARSSLAGSARVLARPLHRGRETVQLSPDFEAERDAVEYYPALGAHTLAQIGLTWPSVRIVELLFEILWLLEGQGTAQPVDNSTFGFLERSFVR